MFKKLIKTVGNLLDSILPDPEKSVNGTLTTKPKTDDFIPVKYGVLGKQKGLLAWKNSSDNPGGLKNELMHYIIVWCEGPIESIDEIYLDDVPMSDSRFDGLVYARHFVHGMNNAYDDPDLVAAGFKPSEWLYAGLAVSYIRVEGDGDIITTDAINFLADGHWKRCQYADTGATQLTASSNNAQQLLDLLHHPIYGKNLKSSDINISSFNAGIAHCDSQISLHQGSSETKSRYTSNISLNTGVEVMENIETLLDSMNADLPTIDGKLTLVFKDDKPAVDPLIEGEHFYAQDLSLEHPAISDRYNRAVVTYLDPEANWQKQEAIWPPVNSQQDIDYQIEDGAEVENNLIVRRIDLIKREELATCTDYYEAVAHARRLVQFSRDALQGEVIAFPQAIKYEPGDIIPIEEPELFGELQKPFIVGDIEWLSNGMVVLPIKEHQPYITTWLSENPKPPIPDTNLPSPHDVTKPTNVVISESVSQTLVVSFDSNYSNFDVWITNAANEIVLELPNRAVTSLDIGYLPDNNYKAHVVAKSKLGYSSDVAESAAFSPNKPASPTLISVENSEVRWQHPAINSVTEFKLKLSTDEGVLSFSLPANTGQAWQRKNLRYLSQADYAIAIVAVGKNGLESAPAVITNAIEGLDGELARLILDSSSSGVNIASAMFGIPWTLESAKPSASHLLSLEVLENQQSPLGETNVWKVKGQSTSFPGQSVEHARDGSDYNIPLTNEDGERLPNSLIVSILAMHDSVANAELELALRTENQTYKQTVTTGSVGVFKRVSAVFDLSGDDALACLFKFIPTETTGHFEYSFLMVEWQVTSNTSPSPYIQPRDSFKSAKVTVDEVIAAITPESLGVLTSAESDLRYGLIAGTNTWSGSNNFTGNTWLNGILIEQVFAAKVHEHDADYLAIDAKAADSELLDGYNSTYFYSPLNNPTLAALGVLDDAHTWSETQTFSKQINASGGIDATAIKEAGTPLDVKYVALAELTYNSTAMQAIATESMKQFEQEQAAGLYDDYDSALGSQALGYLNAFFTQANFLVANSANIQKLSVDILQANQAWFESLFTNKTTINDGSLHFIPAGETSGTTISGESEGGFGSLKFISDSHTNLIRQITSNPDVHVLQHLTPSTYQLQYFANPVGGPSKAQYGQIAFSHELYSGSYYGNTVINAKDSPALLQLDKDGLSLGSAFRLTPKQGTSADANAYLNLSNANGNLWFGRGNTSFAHFFTDSNLGYYFNKNLQAVGMVGVFNSGTYITATDIYEAGSKLEDKYQEVKKQSFRVLGSSSRFYKVKILLGNRGHVRVSRRYFESIGGSNPDGNWNNGSTTHLGALDLNLDFVSNEWGGQQSSLTGVHNWEYTQTCADALCGGSDENDYLIVYLRGSSQGEGALYHVDSMCDGALSVEVTTSYITTIQEQFRASQGLINRYVHHQQQISAGTITADNILLDGYEANGDAHNAIIQPANDDSRHAGMYGRYDSTRFNHIWSLGEAFKILPDGVNLGNHYGMAYGHVNNPGLPTLAGGHQILFTSSGSINASVSLTYGSFYSTGSYLTSSDPRFKTFLESIDPQLALDGIEALYVGRYTRIDDEENKIFSGVNALQAQGIFPTLVSGKYEAGDSLSFDYAGLSVFNAAAIKQLAFNDRDIYSRITDLETQIKQLKEAA